MKMHETISAEMLRQRIHAEEGMAKLKMRPALSFGYLTILLETTRTTYDVASFHFIYQEKQKII